MCYVDVGMVVLPALPWDNLGNHRGSLDDNYDSLQDNNTYVHSHTF